MNGPPRKQVLDQLDALQREIAEYHRWLAEFPGVCRVLENMMLRIERPLPGSDQTRYRSISNLRDELRSMRAAQTRRPDLPERATLEAIGSVIGYGRAQQILGELWEAKHDCAPRGRMGVTAKDGTTHGAGGNHV
jgi:hypothetical protein